MADTKSAVIRIQTLEAVRNVKELKDNIAALKKRIDDVNTSTDEYASLTKQLQQNQAALRNVMNGTNSTFQESITAAQGLDTSYNSLVEQLKEATQEWRSIPQYLTAVDQEQGKVNEAWKDAADKVLNLRTQLKNMDETTGSYVRNVGNYKSAFDGLNNSMKNVKQIGNGVNQGVNALVGTMSMLGIATNEDNRAMKSWQATMAVINGGQGLLQMLSGLKNVLLAKKAETEQTQKETIAEAQNTVVTRENTVAKEVADKATKKLTVSTIALKAAMLGIAALALGALIANWDKVSEALDKAGRKLREFFGIASDNETVLIRQKLSVSGYTKTMEEMSTSLERDIAKMRAAGADEMEVLNAQLSGHTEMLETAKVKLVEVKDAVNDVGDAVDDIAARPGAQAFEKIFRWVTGGAAVTKAAEKDIEDLEKEVSNDEFAIELETIRREAEKVREEAEKAREAQRKAIEAAKRRAEELEDAVKKALDKSKEASVKILKPIEQISASYKDQYDLMYSGLTALDQQAKSGKNLEDIAKKRKTIEEGILALQKLETKELNEQAAKEFERLIDIKSEYYKFLSEEQQAGFSRITSIMKNSLGYTDAQIQLIFQGVKTYSNELQQQLSINRQLLKVIEEETNGYEGLREGMESYFGFATDKLEDLLSDAFLFSVENPDEFAKTFSEPLASAIKRTYEITLSNESLKRSMLDMVTSVNDEIFNKALKDNNSSAAFTQAAKFISGISSVYKAFFGTEPPQELSDAFASYQKNMFEKSFEVLINSDFNVKNALNVGKKLIDAMFPEEETGKYLEKRLEMWGLLVNRFAETYGQSTANLLGNVSNMWDGFLKLRYKKQVENGKLTEEEAKAQAENQFKWVKALQYGAAAINTAAAVTAALADATVPTYVRFVNAAAALAAGTAQVLQISMTNFGAPQIDQSKLSTPTPVDRTPPLQYTIGLNSEEYAAAMAENPIRAYVTDKDLDDGLTQYNRRRNATTF